MKVKTTADRTKADHNKQDIDDQNKETKGLMAEGGSEDGRHERGKVGTTGGEPDTGNDEDKVRRVNAKMKVTKRTKDKHDRDKTERKMIAKIQEMGDAITSDHRRKAIAEIQGESRDDNLPYSQHLRGKTYDAEDTGHNVVHEDEGMGRGPGYRYRGHGAQDEEQGQ